MSWLQSLSLSLFYIDQTLSASGDSLSGLVSIADKIAEVSVWHPSIVNVNTISVADSRGDVSIDISRFKKLENLVFELSESAKKLKTSGSYRNSFISLKIRALVFP
ncbi:hypothetical protein NPIL_314941 [Nephila pilipes]|uniref:Uncharacterized protein n=1 Tax=Nephila pilipes TaxID=299642 RepID=A0A8X6NYQ4_NEPPI|nr:hypothetical protein NPIL_314941 [Nephila pilipes]